MPNMQTIDHNMKEEFALRTFIQIFSTFDLDLRLQGQTERPKASLLSSQRRPILCQI